MNKTIFHIDANSAFLSWTAAYRVKVLGDSFDLRTVPSAIAGDKDSRQGVILAKSQPAKKFGVQTGEPIGMALQKCPSLILAPADYSLYVAASRKMISLLREFSPAVEQYSIDEAWVDMSGTRLLHGDPLLAAERIKTQIKERLGFTVNVGISSNKLLAKMAGDFEKPDKIHTLYPEEIERKLWPLPVRELFMVGHATEQKLHMMGVYTIGDLAKTNPDFLRAKLHKPGLTLWHYANGRGDETLTPIAPENQGYGNATTTAADVTDRETAHRILLSLCETVCMRMRRDGKYAGCVAVSLRSSGFQNWSHQQKLHNRTDVTEELFRAACCVFDEAWDGKTPLRQLGVHATQVAEEQYRQFDLWQVQSAAQFERKARLDCVVDELREKYGERAVFRGSFVGTQNHMAGGLSKERRTGITKPVGPEYEKAIGAEKSHLPSPIA